MLRVAADVVLGGGHGRHGGASRRHALAWLVAGFGFMGEIVGVVLTGVVRVRVGFESSVDDGGRRIDVHFTDSGTAWCPSALATLSANVADGSCQEWMYEFGVVFIHDLAVNEGQVLGLLGEGCPHESQL